MASDYRADWQLEMRHGARHQLCADESCDLSGGEAHVGPCTPCSCGKRHAIEECPHRSTEFTFRGKAISGWSACALLRAIRRVEALAPNATPEDVEALAAIQAQFSKEFERSLGAPRTEAELREERDWVA
jgi:hypothetical protein